MFSFNTKTKNRFKWLCIAVSIIGVALCLYFVFKFNAPEPRQEVVRKIPKKYFDFIPLTFSVNGDPLVSVDIDGETFPVLLDLGYRGHITLLDKHLEKIASKKQIGTKLMYNFKGDTYQATLYTIPNLKLCEATWHNLTLQDKSEAFERLTKFNKDPDASVTCFEGKLGWELFQSLNLFVDLGNSEVAFCDGIETLKEEGYQVDTWVKTPLLKDKGLLEIEAITPDGLTRCVLDNGVTFNIFNKELAGQTLTEAFFDPDNFIEYSFFEINGANIGPIELCQIPINLPIPVSIMLGEEFFLEHKVFFDFKENYVYISPINDKPSSTAELIIP